LRNAAVFMAVVLALSLVRFFQEILSPLVVAAFMIVLVDGISRVPPPGCVPASAGR
jgi:predicted PurR-regulated permease PerM